MFGKECKRMPQLWNCLLVCVGLAPWQSMWVSSSQQLGLEGLLLFQSPEIWGLL